MNEIKERMYKTTIHFFYTSLKTKIIKSDNFVCIEYHAPTILPGYNEAKDHNIYHDYPSFLFSFVSALTISDQLSGEQMFSKNMNFVCPTE
jgi:hypothetical protein